MGKGGKDHGVGTGTQPPGGIAHSAGIETHGNDVVLHLGPTPSVAGVEPQTPRGTRGVLTQVGLCAAGSFPTFGALRPLTGGLPDREEGQGPLLTCGCYQGEAPGDINLRRSPLLEHYR